MQVAKWGNSLAVRLPVALVQQMGLQAGDEVELLPADSQKLALQLVRKPSREERIEQLKKYEGRLPKGYRFNREEANER